MRRDESSIAVHGSDAVGVSVEGKSCVKFTSAQSLAQRFDVRFDGFGIDSAKERVSRTANFLAFDSVAAKKIAQQAASRSMHWVDKEPELRSAQPIPVH